MSLFKSTISFQLLLLFFFLSVVTQTFAKNNQENKNDIKVIFEKIENGIDKKDVDLFSQYFDDRTLVNLPNGNNGHFSANQTHYVVQSFLSLCQSVSIQVNTISIEEDFPFISGIINYYSNSSQETARIFISLKVVGKTWKISQITIN